MPPSSKKDLLAKLKKERERKRAQRAEEEEEVSRQPQPESLQDPTRVHHERHAHLVQRLNQLVVETPFPRNDILDTIRNHVAQYEEEDYVLRRVLTLDNAGLQSFIQLSPRYVDRLLKFTEGFVKKWNDERRENWFDQFQHQLRSIEPQDLTLQTLLELNPEVFRPLEFQMTYQNQLLPSLVDMLVALPNTITPIEMQKHVEQFLYNHRFDFVLSYLQNPETTDDDKNRFTHVMLKEMFESMRSKRLFFEIMTLVDEKRRDFAARLPSILYRSIPERETIPAIRKFLEIVLHVVILQSPDATLRSLFPSNVQFERFKKTVLPSLQTKEGIESIVHQQCINAIDQPYLFKMSDKINHQMFLDAIQRHIQTPLTSIEFDLYDRLHKNQDEKLEHVFVLLNQTPPINRQQFNTILERYIVTQPYKSQQTLRKLMTLSIDKVKDVLMNHQANQYVQILRDMTIDEPRTDTLVPPSNDVDAQEMQTDTYELIERTRPFIPNFDHVAIAPIDDVDITTYIQSPDNTSTTYFLPNDQFFKDLVDPAIQKQQRGDQFMLGNRIMTVANVTVYNQYIVQDERTFLEGQQFLQSQYRLVSTTHPIAFFREFERMPMLNHQSQFMERFRNKNRVMMSTLITRRLPSLSRVHSIVMEMETSIYTHSANMGEYVDKMSLMVPLIHTSTSSLSTHSNFFVSLIQRNGFDWSHIGEVLSTPSLERVMEMFFPEAIYDESGVLKGLYQQDMALVKRQILVDAYTTQFPMRRIPYLPTSTSLRSFRLDKININTQALQQHVVPDKTWFIQIITTTTEETQETKEQEEMVITTLPPPPQQEETQDDDPLRFFKQVAFEELYNL